MIVGALPQQGCLAPNGGGRHAWRQLNDLRAGNLAAGSGFVAVNSVLPGV
jgi:hypothetical protein